MIGKPVSKEELDKLLNREAGRDKIVAELRAELRAIKPGECLKYEAPSGSGMLTQLGFIAFLSGIEGIKTIAKDECVYAYRD